MVTATRERKSFAAELKVPEDAAPGVFEGYASIFGNVDSYGDVMEPGSFKRSLAERGLPMLSWEHMWGAGPIGEVLAASEDAKGLRVEGQLFVDDPMVGRIYRSLKAGQIQEMSFSFNIVDAGDETEDGETTRHVKDVDLYEVALVVVGANSETGILEVRSPAKTDAEVEAELDALIAKREEKQRRLDRLAAIDFSLTHPSYWEGISTETDKEND